jgi:transposase
MASSFSTDLRRRLVDFMEEGHSAGEAARRFRVSRSFAVKLKASWRRWRSLAPGKQGRPRGHGKLQAHHAYLMARLEEQPDVTMPALAEMLRRDRGVRVHPIASRGVV